MVKENTKVRNIPEDILLKLQKDVELIKTALLGNEYNPTGGLSFRTSELEKELEKLRNRYDKMIWTAAGAGATISFIVTTLGFILDKIL